MVLRIFGRLHLGKHRNVYAGESDRLKFPEYVIVEECWIQHRSTVKLFNWSALNVTVIESIIKNLETLPVSKLVEVEESQASHWNRFLPVASWWTAACFEKRGSRGDWGRRPTGKQWSLIRRRNSERGSRAGQGKDKVRVGIHGFRGRYVFLSRICPGTQNAESNGQGEVDEGIAHCRLQHWIVTSQSDSLDRTQCDLAMGAYTAFLDLDARTRQPGARLVASGAGLGTVFLVSMLVRALRRG
jgi:hypothetical protein